MKVVVAIAVLGGLAWAWVVQRRRRARNFEKFKTVVRDLGFVIGSQRVRSSTFEGVEGRSIVLKVDGKRLELDLIKAFEINDEPDSARRWQRLRFFVDQARIRQGV